MHQEFSAAQGQPAAGAKEAAAKERRQANRMPWYIIWGGVGMKRVDPGDGDAGPQFPELKPTGKTLPGNPGIEDIEVITP